MAFRVVNKSVKKCKDTANTSYTLPLSPDNLGGSSGSSDFTKNAQFKIQVQNQLFTLYDHIPAC